MVEHGWRILKALYSKGVEEMEDFLRFQTFIKYLSSL